MYALATTTGVDAVGPLPRAARRLDTGQWVTPPPDGWTDTLAAACGWLPVVESPRSADTATDTYEPTYTVDGATVVQSWTLRPWTAEELAAKAEQAANEALRATVKAIINDLRAEKARAQTVIDTPNATINTSPAPHIKDVARAAKRIADAAIDLARFVAP